MKKAKIIEISSSSVHTTTKNTDLSQRQTLEETLMNLATLAQAKTVEKFRGQSGYYYAVPSVPKAATFQRASNTILELSRQLLEAKG